MHEPTQRFLHGRIQQAASRVAWLKMLSRDWRAWQNTIEEEERAPAALQLLQAPLSLPGVGLRI